MFDLNHHHTVEVSVTQYPVSFDIAMYSLAAFGLALTLLTIIAAVLFVRASVALDRSQPRPKRTAPERTFQTIYPISEPTKKE